MTLRLAELVDVSTFPPASGGSVVLDLTGQRITGARVVLEWVVRSWFMPRGVLRGKAKGLDLRGLENATVGPGDLDRWRGALVAEAERVDFVQRCAVSVELNGRVIEVTAQVTLVDGKTYPLAVRIADAIPLVTIGGTT